MASEAACFGAYSSLLDRVFGKPARSIWPGGPAWRLFAVLDQAALQCVAGLEAARLPLVIDGEVRDVIGFRDVAVDPDHRGRGLFRSLMEKAIGWADAQAVATILLYTADPALYTRFGFEPVHQHAFEGPPPPPAERHGGPSRGSLDDAGLVRRLGNRIPVSGQVAIGDAPGLFLDYYRTSRTTQFACLRESDAIVAFEVEDEGDRVTIVDVVAQRIPALATILGALDLRPAIVRTLFPPDRLRWSGTPVGEDAGLMRRGPWPRAATTAFMLPPSAEF